MWRAVTFALSSSGSDAGRQLSSFSVNNTRKAAVSGQPSAAAIPVATVQNTLGSLLPASLQVTISQEATTGNVAVSIMEGSAGSGLRAEQILQLMFAVPERISSETNAHLYFASPPTIVLVSVSAPPPPPQPPKDPPPRSPPSMPPPTPHTPALSSAAASQSSLNGEGGANPILLVVAAVGAAAAALVFVTFRRRMCNGRITGSAPKDLLAAQSVDAHVIDVAHEKDDGTSEPACPPKKLSEPQAFVETLAAALAPASDSIHVPTALQRVRSLRMRASPPRACSAAPTESSPEEDSSAAEVELELDMEFGMLRENMQRRSSATENIPRLEQLRTQVQRADAIILAHQNRVRSVLSKKLLSDLPSEHLLRTFDPDCFANRALVAQQASVLVTDARRRVRMRLCEEQNCATAVSTDANLDRITGAIKRASLTGGRIHASDLTSRSIRGTEGKHDPECSPEEWLVGAMSMSCESGEPAANVEFHFRMSRARAKNAADGSSSRQRSAFKRIDVQPSALHSSPDPLTSPAKPRSLFEIRRSSRDSSSTVTSTRQEEGEAEALDPLTNALHVAEIMGIEPPPPPRDHWSDEVDLVKLTRDAPERVRRARKDRETRLAPATAPAAASAPADATNGSCDTWTTRRLDAATLQNAKANLPTPSTPESSGQASPAEMCATPAVTTSASESTSPASVPNGGEHWV